MKVNPIASTRCVRRCLQDCTYAGKSLLAYNDSNQRRKKVSSEHMVIFYFQNLHRDCKLKKFHTTGTQKKNDFCSVDGLCALCDTFFEAPDCFSSFCQFQVTQPGFIDKDVVTRQRKKEKDQLRWC